MKQNVVIVLLASLVAVALIWCALPRWYGVAPGYGVHGWRSCYVCRDDNDPEKRIGKALAFGPLGKAL